MERYADNAALSSRFAFLTNVAQRDLPETLAERAARGLLTLADGEAELADGIRLVPAFGTTRPARSTSSSKTTQTAARILCGDLFYVYENVEGLRGDGAPAPIATTTGSHTPSGSCCRRALDAVDGDTTACRCSTTPTVWRAVRLARVRRRASRRGVDAAPVAMRRPPVAATRRPTSATASPATATSASPCETARCRRSLRRGPVPVLLARRM